MICTAYHTSPNWSCLLSGNLRHSNDLALGKRIGTRWNLEMAEYGTYIGFGPEDELATDARYGAIRAGYFSGRPIFL
jgi:hypothetical protein